MNRLDYDFSASEKQAKNPIVRFGALEVATRQKACALEVKRYLKAHPRAAVVNLGCGLDQTAEACDNGTCKIYNVDFPDIIAIRNQLIPAGERVTHVSTDLNDFSWFDKIDGNDGAVFFGTGVFYYFSLEQMQALLNGMAVHFPGGAIVFDITGKLAAKVGVRGYIKKSGIQGVFTAFYVNDVDKDIAPWLKHAKASAKPYMTGYFDLKEKSIHGWQRFFSWVADHMMKMKIVKVEFEGK